jgi:MFS family permease
MAISRGLNGIGLALVIPAINSLVADYTDDHTRGAAFGWLQMTCNLGSIVGGSFGVLLAPTTFLGVDGWRLAFHIVGVISVALGVLMWFFAADPVAKSKDAKEEAKELLQFARAVVAVPTFQVIVAQGIAGLIAWSGLNFSTMWLELVGFTHWETSIITGLYLFATALGALFGGTTGDTVSRRFPDTGRIALAQISSASALPLGAILLLALPNDPSTGVAHAVVFFIMGFAISWNAASTNKYGDRPHQKEFSADLKHLLLHCIAHSSNLFLDAAPSSLRSCRRRRERRFTRWTSASNRCWLRLRLSLLVF